MWKRGYQGPFLFGVHHVRPTTFRTGTKDRAGTTVRQVQSANVLDAGRAIHTFSPTNSYTSTTIHRPSSVRSERTTEQVNLSYLTFILFCFCFCLLFCFC